MLLQRLFLLLIFVAVLLKPPSASGAVIREDMSEIEQETGLPLYLWRDPDVAPPARVLIAVHGSAQQGAVMDGLARAIVPQGYLVIAPDVRGNGRWQLSLPPGASANLALSESCADLGRILLLVNKLFPKSDIFCLGESIGAGVVLKAVSENPRSVKGVILCSAGVRPHLHNPLNMGGGMIKQLVHPTQPVDLSNFLSRYCSEDPRIVNEMLSDPLGKNRQSGMELLQTFAFLTQEPSFAAQLPRSIPVLMVQGAEDQIVDPMSVNDIFEVLRSHEKRLVMVPGCGHIVVGTAFIKPEVLACIEQWLQGHASGKKLKHS